MVFSQTECKQFKSLLRESLKTASEEELTSHLGCEKYQESENSNYRNGHNKKSLKTKYGEVDVSIPRDRNGTFEPQIVKKHQTTISDEIEEKILSMYGLGMSYTDISKHIEDI